MNKIKSETMLRIRDKTLIDKLQEMYDLSHCTSVNDFFNKLLHTIAFKKDMQEEIIEQLDYIEDKTNAILEIVKKNAR